MLRPATLTVLAVAALATVACADEADPGGGAGGGDRPSSVSAALAVLPEDGLGNDGGFETITWSDLAAAAEIAGVERPGSSDDPQAVVDYLNAITGGPTAAGEPSPVAAVPPEVANVTVAATEMGEFREEVGWDLLDVDRFAEQYAPPDSVTVIEGDVDERSLDEALGEPDDGTWSVGSEGEVDLAEVSPARRLGEALFLTVVPGGLAVTRSTDLTPEVRALAGDDARSLADDPQLAALAAALDAEDAYSAMLVRPGLEAAAGSAASGVDICDQALPGVPAATATGITEDGGPVILVAHAYGSGDEAEAAAERLESLVNEGSSLARRADWDELVTLDDASVTGPADTLVVARLRPTEDGRAGIWRDLVLVRDGLVAGC